jgi:hypothetical protein
MSRRVVANITMIPITKLEEAIEIRDWIYKKLYMKWASTKIVFPFQSLLLIVAVKHVN